MTEAGDWLEAFSAAADAVADLFVPDATWRDYLAFDSTLQTVEGHGPLADLVARRGPAAAFGAIEVEGEASGGTSFRFRTRRGPGRGLVRLDGGRATTLFTMLEDLDRLVGASESPPHDGGSPSVLIVGGGQGGLVLGAQLDDLGVSYLIVDKHPRVGDQWRSRYDSLILHDPKWYNHLPFEPFPDDWPVFTPKDMMGDWLERYAQRRALAIWTGTECQSASWDERVERWTVQVERDGESIALSPTHLVLALGISGFPRRPEFEGAAAFTGPQFHSSEYRSGREFAGAEVVVVGGNNSAHDVAADLVAHGARPTLIQRSPTLVIRQTDYCEQMLGSSYSASAVAAGVDAAESDFRLASVPMRQFEDAQRIVWDGIRNGAQEFYAHLAASGFRLNLSDVGGLGPRYRRTASGYYIDVGASEMVADGRIGVRSGVNVNRITSSGVELDSGEELPAAAIVYATGFGNMTDLVSALISPEVAAQVGPVWGYGSDTPGDPGPWVGELRNMWMPTAQPGLWFMGGNLAQTRFYSRLLALQLKERIHSL